MSDYRPGHFGISRDLPHGTMTRLTPGPNARDQDVNQTFGGPLTIGSRPYVRNTGERAQQVERIKVKRKRPSYVDRWLSPVLSS